MREQSSARKTQDSRRPRELPTGTALLANTPLQCCFCQPEHSSQDCKVVVGVEARREKLRRNGRCYICLARGHVSRNCRRWFMCLSCKGRHHLAICPEMLQSKANYSSNPSPASKSSHNASALNPKAQDYQPASTHTMWTYSGKHVLLQTARATAFNPNDLSRTCSVRIVMDTGSQRSYTTDRVREMLALASVREQCMTIMTFGDSEGTNCICGCVEVGIKLKKGCSRLLTIFTVPNICEPLTPHSLASCREFYPHLRGLELADEFEDIYKLQLDLLIDSDYYWDFITGTILRGSDGPVAIDTRLGWVFSGQVSCPEEICSLVTHTLHVSSTESELQSLSETMKSFWDLESFGLPETDTSVYDEFCDTVKFQDGRYEVQLPWKLPRRDPPNNYELSLMRLKGLRRRLKHTPDVLHEYNAIIKTQLIQEIVELMEEPLGDDNPGVHYLPHHAVIRQDK